MARLNLSSPWVLFYHEVDVFFKPDPYVNVVLDDKDPNDLKLFIYVDEYAACCEGKAEAIRKLLPQKKDFGLQALWITVVPSSEFVVRAFNKANNSIACKGYFDLPNTVDELLRTAFCTNQALDDIKKIIGVFSNPIYYVIFSKKVVQYFTDELSDANGVRSTLYQDIAKDIFVPIDGVYYNTNIEEEMEIF